MDQVIFFVVFAVFVFVVLFVVLGLLRTWLLQHGVRQKLFLQGKLPKEPLSGFYKGAVYGYMGPWKGKKFNSKNNQGMNVFGGGKTTVEQFPFTTYTGEGFRDMQISTIKIDYNVAGNSFFVRKILDEIVEVSPGKFLGKMHIRLLPFFSLTVGYFTLDKE